MTCTLVKRRLNSSFHRISPMNTESEPKSVHLIHKTNLIIPGNIISKLKTTPRVFENSVNLHSIKNLKRNIARESFPRIIVYFYGEFKNSDAGGTRRDYLDAMRCRQRTYLIIRSVNRGEPVRAHCLHSVHAQKEFLISKRRR